MPGWLKPHLQALAVRETDRDYWSNYYADNRSMPFGAGLCIRRGVATAHMHALSARPGSIELDRKGSSLISAGDIDLALSAHDAGFGTALFSRLHVMHLIPKARMTVPYMCRLLEGIEYSTHLLRRQRNANYKLPQKSRLKLFVRRYQIWRLPEPMRSLAMAENRGFEKAKAEIGDKS